MPSVLTGDGTCALAVLVNGLPGSGKTILARALSRHLGLPLFSKDVIKETHADVRHVVVRAWPARARPAVVEIWCDVPLETTRRRNGAATHYPARRPQAISAWIQAALRSAND